MTGRSLQMKPRNASSGKRCEIGPALDEEIEHRRVCEEIINFLEIEHIRKDASRRPAPTACRSAWKLGRALAMEPELLLLD